MINKEIELIIDKLCRCCMCENENMHTLFQEAENSNESTMVSLSEMLKACASVEVNIFKILNDVFIQLVLGKV